MVFQFYTSFSPSLKISSYTIIQLISHICSLTDPATLRIISHPVTHALDDASVLAATALCDPRSWFYEGDREQIGLSEVRFQAMFGLSATL